MSDRNISAQQSTYPIAWPIRSSSPPSSTSRTRFIGTDAACLVAVQSRVDLLCLDLANSIPNISRWGSSEHLIFAVQVCGISNKELWFLLRLPHLEECDLYYVNRDTLFSYHKDSEIFLQVQIKDILFCILRSYIYKIRLIILK